MRIYPGRRQRTAYDYFSMALAVIAVILIVILIIRISISDTQEVEAAVIRNRVVHVVSYPVVESPPDAIEVTAEGPVDPVEGIYEAEAVPYEVQETMAVTAAKAAGAMESVGRFKLTFYCSCRRCSGKWGHQTSSGAYCTEGRTVATDYFKAGTRIYIDGIGERVVEDTGVHGRHIDIFLEDHDQCNENGIKYAEVYVLK